MIPKIINTKDAITRNISIGAITKYQGQSIILVNLNTNRRAWITAVKPPNLKSILYFNLTTSFIISHTIHDNAS